ncbi:hypothetical protein LXL04_029533 [Taraxacum kok-saghyz]
MSKASPKGLPASCSSLSGPVFPPAKKRREVEVDVRCGHKKKESRAVQMRTIIGGGNGGTNLGHLFQFAADQFSDAGALLSAQHIERERERESRNILKTHIASRTHKPLTFSKNRLRGLKNTLIQARFVSLHIYGFPTFVLKMFKYVQIPEFFRNHFYRGLHNTYSKKFGKNVPKKVAYRLVPIRSRFSEKKKKADFIYFECFLMFQNRFFKRSNGLEDIEFISKEQIRAYK